MISDFFSKRKITQFLKRATVVAPKISTPSIQQKDLTVIKTDSVEDVDKSGWETFSWTARIQECVLKRDGNLGCLHLNLSKQSGVLLILDEKIPDVIETIEHYLTEFLKKYPNDKIDLDLSGHRMRSAASMKAICDLIRTQKSIRSLNISDNNFFGFAAFGLLSEALLGETGLEEINVAGIHSRIEMYVLEAILLSPTLKKVNGYCSKETDFNQVGFMVHKERWKKKFLATKVARDKTGTVTLDLSGQLSKYHDVSEIAAWIANWSRANPNVKIEIDASKNALTAKDLLSLTDLINNKDLAVIGLDVSDNALDFVSCKIIGDVLLSETKLEKISFANTNLYVKDYLASAVEANKNRKDSPLKFVNGYELSKTPLEEINYLQDWHDDFKIRDFIRK